MSVSPATAGVGFTAATLANSTVVEAIIGEHANIDTGSYQQSAKLKGDYQIYVVTASAGTGATSTANVAANVAVIVMDNHVLSEIGEDSTIISQTGDVAIDAGSELYLLAPIISVAGTAGRVAAGGSIVVIVSNADTKLSVADGVSITSAGAIKLSSTAVEKLISVLASLSVAPTGGAGAGNLSVLITNASTIIELGKLNLLASGDIDIQARGDDWLLVVGASVAGSGASPAVGATLAVNILQKIVHAIVGAESLLQSANGSVRVQASGEDQLLSVALALGASTSSSVSGVIGTTVSTNDIRSEIGEGTTIEAADSVGIIADADSGVYLILGSVAGGANAGVGAGVSTAVLQSKLRAIVNRLIKITAHGIAPAGCDTALLGIQTPNREQRRRGIVVSAVGREDIVMASVAGAGGATLGVGGAVNTLVVTNSALAQVMQNASLNAHGREVQVKTTKNGQEKISDSSSDVHIEAEDESFLLDLAGAVGASGATGVGATAVALVFDKEVKALAEGSINSEYGDVTLQSRSKDEVYLLSLGVGASGTVGVAGDVNALVFMSKTHAVLSGIVEKARDVNLLADADSTLINIAVGAAGAGGTAVTGVAVITYFQNETLAKLGEQSRVGSLSVPVLRNVNMLASSKELVSSDAAGFSGSGTASVGGTLDVIVTMVNTQAIVGDGASIFAIDDVIVDALDQYELIGVVGTVAASGTAGVGVSALVSVGHNSVAAGIGQGALVQGRNIELLAKSKKDILTTVASVGASATAGIGASLTVLVSGTRMNQDAHDTLYTSGALDPQAQLMGALSAANPAASGYASELPSLNTLLEGDAQSQTQGDYSNYGQNAADKSKINAPDIQTVAKPISGLADTTSAVVMSGATLSAVLGDINILSTDAISANIISGTAGASAGAGVGASVTAVTLFSNVIARANEGANLTADGNITIHASTGASDEVIGNIASPKTDRDSNANEVIGKQNAIVQALRDEQGLEIEDAASNNNIRLISVSAAGGTAGVGVGLSVLTVFTEVEAVLEAKVRGANEMKVMGDMAFKQVMVINTSVSGGVSAISASVGVSYLAGEVKTAITGNADISGIMKEAAVLTNGSAKLTSASGVAAGGATAAVNAGAAVAVNRTKLRTYIGPAVVLQALGRDIKLGSKFDASAYSYLIDVSGGTAAVGASVSVVINELDSISYIGNDPQSSETIGTGLVSAKNIAVTSDIIAQMQVDVAAVSGGVVGANAAVALGFNDSVGIASIHKANINAGSLNLKALMDGDVTINVLGLSGGQVAAGASVAVGRINTNNQASIDLTNGAINVTNDITVHAGEADKPYNSEATVLVLTGKAGVVTGAINIAVATNASKNQALITGGGNINMLTSGYSNSVIVTVNGNANAIAKVIENNVNVDLVIIASNITKADLKLEQKAGIDISGKLDALGNVYVQSIFATPRGAEAASGVDNGAKVNLINGSGTEARANSSVKNEASVKGSGSIKTSGNLYIISDSNTRANANVATPVSVSVLSINVMLASAFTSDETIAELGVSSADVNRFYMQGMGNADVEAIGSAGVSVELISGAGGNVASGVGSKDKRQSVKVLVKDNSNIKSRTKVDIDAKNTGSAHASMRRGVNVAGISVNVQIVPTESWYHTEVSLGKNASIDAGQSIKLEAAGRADARSVVNGMSVGIVASVNNKYAENRIDERVLIRLGKGSSLHSFGQYDANYNGSGTSILLNAYANSALNSHTINESDSMFAGVGVLQAKSTLVRDIDVILDEDSSISTEFGNIEILSGVNSGSYIEAKAENTANGFVGVGSSKVIAYYDGHSDLVVGKNARIINRFGKVTLRAEDGLTTSITSDMSAGGAKGDPEARAELRGVDRDNALIHAKLHVQDGAQILADDLLLLAALDDMDIRAYTAAVASGIAVYSYCFSRAYLDIECVVDIDRASISAYDSLDIIANPMYNAKPKSIVCEAHSTIKGVGGTGNATAELKGSSAALVQLGAADIRGKRVRIASEKFDHTVVKLKDIVSDGAVFSQTRHHKQNDYEKGAKNYDKTTVVSDTDFHIGGGAAGIYVQTLPLHNGSIDYADGYNTVLLRSVGAEQNVHSVLDLSNPSDVITLPNLKNTTGGTLSIDCSVASNDVYGTRYIHSIVIDNNTARPLKLGRIDAYNVSYTWPIISGARPSRRNQESMNTSKITAPEVLINTMGTGYVQLQDVLMNPTGTVKFSWTDADTMDDQGVYDENYGGLISGLGTVGSAQNVPLIWAHALIIDKPAYVGKEGERVSALMFSTAEQDASVEVETYRPSDPYASWIDGDVWLALYQGRLNHSTSSTSFAAPTEGSLNLKRILAYLNLDILLPKPLSVNLSEYGTYAKAIDGSSYIFTQLDGFVVNVRIEDEDSRVLGGNSDTNINARHSLTVRSNSNKSFGTTKAPVNIKATYFRDLKDFDGNELFLQSSFIYWEPDSEDSASIRRAQADADGNDVCELTRLPQTGEHLIVVTKDASVILPDEFSGNITVRTNAIPIWDGDKLVGFIDNPDAKSAGNITMDDVYTYANTIELIGGNVFIDSFESVGDPNEHAVLDITARNDITINSINSVYTWGWTDVRLDAGGDIRIGRANINGEASIQADGGVQLQDANITAGEDNHTVIRSGQELDTNSLTLVGDATLVAGGSIENFSSEYARATLSHSDGTLELSMGSGEWRNELNLNNSKLDMHVPGDYYSWGEITNSHVSIVADGMLNTNGRIHGSQVSYKGKGTAVLDSIDLVDSELNIVVERTGDADNLASGNVQISQQISDPDLFDPNDIHITNSTLSIRADGDINVISGELSRADTPEGIESRNTYGAYGTTYIQNGSLQLESVYGGIEWDALNIENGTASFRAGGDITINSDGYAYDYLIVGRGYMGMTDAMPFGEVQLEDSSLQLVSERGSVQLGDYSGEDSELIIQAGTDLRINRKEKETDGHLDIAAPSGTLASNGGSVQINTGEILMGELILDDSEAELHAQQDVRIAQASLKDSALKLETGSGDIRFDSISADSSEIELAAGGDIGAAKGIDCGDAGQRAAIILSDSDNSREASLNLAAGGDIGAEDSPLLIDIPQGVTLVIEKVNDTFIEGHALNILKQSADEPGSFDELPSGSHEQIDRIEMDEAANEQLKIEIGESTGSHSISNDGDLSLSVQNGDLLVETITSNGGDVEIQVPQGSILGQQGELERVDAHIIGENLVLVAGDALGGHDAPLLYTAPGEVELQSDPGSDYSVNLNTAFDHEHQWDGGSVTLEPSCTSTGIRTHNCTLDGCKAKKNAVIPLVAHQYESSETTAPSCTETGVMTHTCSMCGHSYSETIAALGHSYEGSYIVEPSCTEPGTIKYICTVCGDSYIADESMGLGHNYECIHKSEASCTQEGTAEYRCSVCHDSYTTSEPALGHDYESVITKPTCTAGGYTSHSCSRCGDSYRDNIKPALGHEYESVITKPTCTADGYTSHSCTLCGDRYTDSIVPALGHEYESVRTQPSDSQDGYTLNTCTRCGYAFISDIVSASGDRLDLKQSARQIGAWFAQGMGVAGIVLDREGAIAPYRVGVLEVRAKQQRTLVIEAELDESGEAYPLRKLLLSRALLDALSERGYTHIRFIFAGIWLEWAIKDMPWEDNIISIESVDETSLSQYAANAIKGKQILMLWRAQCTALIDDTLSDTAGHIPSLQSGIAPPKPSASLQSLLPDLPLIALTD